MITFESDDWKNIFKSVSEDAYDIFSKYEFRTKLKSEIVSSLVVSHAEKYFNSKGRIVRKDKTDRDPDLFFTKENLPLEIKVSRHSKSLKWQGGEYSKRYGQFVLVSWRMMEANLFNERGMEFYAITCILDNSDFISLGPDYYGTGFSAEKLIQKNGIELVGKNFILERFPL